VKPPGRLRWWIGAILFLSTVINYIDRQTLSVLGPTLQSEYRWTNADFALVIISFRLAYTLGQGGAGWFLDAVGTRTGLSVTVTFYSVAAMLTSLASGLRSFCFFRFLLGAGEAGNWPGATKAVAEWFPRRESGWAVALFDSGSSIGAAIAPLLVVGLLHRSAAGGRRSCSRARSALWLLLPDRTTTRPSHPRFRVSVSLADREPAGTRRSRCFTGLHPPSACRRPGHHIGKALTDPVWFFITDWFAIYLSRAGSRWSLLAFWVPFLAADAGNFLGDGLSATSPSRFFGRRARSSS
jgi:ACS family hexuronate transporter-like MFS transporter